MQETQFWSLSGEDPLEKEITTHSSILALRIPWTEEPGGLQSMGDKESDTTEQLSMIIWFKEWKYFPLQRIVCFWPRIYGPSNLRSQSISRNWGNLKLSRILYENVPDLT